MESLRRILLILKGEFKVTPNLEKDLLAFRIYSAAVHIIGLVVFMVSGYFISWGVLLAGSSLTIGSGLGLAYFYRKYVPLLREEFIKSIMES